MKAFNLLIGTFFLFNFYFLPSHASTILYLQGTCSSGKSTLIHALSKEINELVIVDEDTLMHGSYVEAVKKRFPQRLAHIQKAIDEVNLYHALREKELLFKTTASDEERSRAVDNLHFIQDELNRPENLLWKQGISRSIDTQVLQSISEALEQNKNVLLDAWYITAERLKADHPETHIVRVLLYCSLPEAYARLQKRNKHAIESGNLLEKRYPRQLAGSFFSLYEISNTPLQPIHKIEIGDLKPTLDLMIQAFTGDDPTYKKPVFTFEEPSKAYFQKMSDEFLKPFECSPNEFYISPRATQDVIIDNTAADIAAAVDLIKKLL